MQVDLEKIIKGDILIDVGKRQVYLKDNPVQLAAKEFELLKILVEHTGRAVKKEKLFNLVWGINSDSDYSTLTVHINKLREKIEKNPKKPELIKTVWGVGYRFEESK
jgi:DNA-binding response OmpR family regulator